MNKALKKINTDVWYYKDGLRIEGIHDGITGTVSSDLRGNVSDLRGDVSGLRGDVDDCGISDEERKKGVNVSDLVSDSDLN